jgi:hypothetical protein
MMQVKEIIGRVDLQVSMSMAAIEIMPLTVFRIMPPAIRKASKPGSRYRENGNVVC